jgi:hypothetical protein
MTPIVVKSKLQSLNMQALKDQTQHVFLNTQQRDLKVSAHGKPTLNNISNQNRKLTVVMNKPE